MPPRRCPASAGYPVAGPVPAARRRYSGRGSYASARGKSALEALNSNFRIVPIADANIEAPVGLIMRRQKPVSSLALRCFTDAQEIYHADNEA